MTIRLVQVYAKMRHRAIDRRQYRPGFKLYEVDLLIRHLRDIGVKFQTFDPRYGICGKSPDLVGGPEIVIVTPPPAAPQAKAVAIWMCGSQHRRPLSEYATAWIEYLRGLGWECCVAFIAEDVRVDLRRLGYENEDDAGRRSS
jgi:hypothetical protein